MIDIKKQYRTRDGREVRIYATDGCGDEPIQGAIRQSYGWEVGTWTVHGHWTGLGTDTDLIEVCPRHKRTVWVNVYNEGGPTAHKLKEQADCYSGRIACIKVELDFEEGEGL